MHRELICVTSVIAEPPRRGPPSGRTPSSTPQPSASSKRNRSGAWASALSSPINVRESAYPLRVRETTCTARRDWACLGETHSTVLDAVDVPLTACGAANARRADEDHEPGCMGAQLHAATAAVVLPAPPPPE